MRPIVGAKECILKTQRQSKSRAPEKANYMCRNVDINIYRVYIYIYDLLQSLDLDVAHEFSEEKYTTRK